MYLLPAHRVVLEYRPKYELVTAAKLSVQSSALLLREVTASLQQTVLFGVFLSDFCY